MTRRLDWPYLGTIVLLCGFGLFALWTVASPGSLQGESLAKSILVRQLAFLAVSGTAMGLLLAPHYRVWGTVAWVPWAGLLLLLAGLLVAGPVTRGARGWIPLGPVNLQPAEFMKIAATILLARHLSRSRNLRTWRGLLVPFAVAGLPAGLIFLQPDLGNAILFFPCLMVMLFTAGARVRHLLIILAVAAVAVPVAYQVGLKPYQRHRLTSFLWPEDVPRALTYQQTQSVKACASGGAVGRAFGDEGGDIPFHVPDRHTDFVYSIIAGELGFVGSTVVLLLIGALFWRAVRIATRTSDPFGRLLVVGLTTFMALQTFINIGMTTGVAPITGLTLPFVSYGGSSLLTCFLSAGLVLNVSSRWVPIFSGRELDSAHREIREIAPATELFAVPAAS